MKKILFLLLFLLSGHITARAETIYTNNAEEYIDAIHMIDINTGLKVSEEKIKDILLVHHEGELNLCGAYYDVCDKYWIHTLFYKNKEDAANAYNYYIENDIPVSYNERLSLTDNQLTEPLSWGTEYTGINIFEEGLIDRYESVTLLPEIKIAVLDSGIDYTHPFLESRIDLTNGYDFYNNDKDPIDDNNHGTHVAGIIADNTLKNVKMIPMKIAGSKGDASLLYFKAAIEKANELKVDVINMSIGTTSEDHAQAQKIVFKSLFDEAYDNGTIVCVSAGNAVGGNKLNSEFIFPAYMESAITVANCTLSGEPSLTSNYGTVIDMAAPGHNIYSTLRDGKYGTMSGTSMACPFVSAAAALLKSYDKYISPAQTDAVLKMNLVGFSNSDELFYGNGILNLRDIKMSIFNSVIVHEDNIKFAMDSTSEMIKNGTVIVSGYIDGILNTVISIDPVSDENFLYEIIFNNFRNCDSVKVYFWDSIGNLKPLSIAYNIK